MVRVNSLVFLAHFPFDLLQGIKGDAEDLAISMLNDTTSKLTSAVSSLPELLEKKRLLDSHTNIATALLDHIKVSEKLLSPQSPLHRRSKPETEARLVLRNRREAHDQTSAGKSPPVSPFDPIADRSRRNHSWKFSPIPQVCSLSLATEPSP